MDKENIVFHSVKPRKDLSGKRFGMLVVVKPIGKIKQRHIVYECVCDCGNNCFVSSAHLSFGDTKSCSLCKKPFGSLKTTPKKPLYRVWDAMIQRCNNPSATSYKNYGAKGISVCERWQKSFDDFILDMGQRPFPAAQIDRIDNNGNYCPENCRWVSTKENCNNMSTNLRISLRGVERTATQWAEHLGVNRSVLYKKIREVGGRKAVAQYVR